MVRHQIHLTLQTDGRRRQHEDGHVEVLESGLWSAPGVVHVCRRALSALIGDHIPSIQMRGDGRCTAFGQAHRGGDRGSDSGIGDVAGVEVLRLECSIVSKHDTAFCGTEDNDVKIVGDPSLEAKITCDIHRSRPRSPDSARRYEDVAICTIWGSCHEKCNRSNRSCCRYDRMALNKRGRCGDIECRIASERDRGSA